MNLQLLAVLAVALLGVVALVYGVAMVSEPAAWIVAGILLLAGAANVDVGGDQ